MTTLILPAADDSFVANAVAERLRNALGLEVNVRFEPRASGIELEPLPGGVDPSLLLREARLGLELAEAARLFRLDGAGQCIVYVRSARVRDFGATDAELATFHALLDEAAALWVRASGFAAAEVRVLTARAGEGLADVRPTLIPVDAAALCRRPLLELAADYAACSDAEEALLALERLVWAEVACMQAAAA